LKKLAGLVKVLMISLENFCSKGIYKMYDLVNVRECVCSLPKVCRRIYDSGRLGFYAVDLCENCIRIDNKEFLVTEERLEGNSKEIAP